MAAQTIILPQAGEVSPLSARIKLAKATNYIGMAMAMLKQGELFAAQAIADVDQIHEDAKATCDVFDPQMGDQTFAELAYAGEYARLVQALNQLECAAHDAIELGGKLGQLATKCKALPDDGTDMWLRLHDRATMRQVRESE